MGAVISKLCGSCFPSKKTDKANNTTNPKLSRIPSLIIQRSQLTCEDDEVRTEYSRVLVRDFEIMGRRQVINSSKLVGREDEIVKVKVSGSLDENEIETKVLFQIIHRESGKPFTLTRINKSSLNRSSAEALCRQIRLLADKLPHHPLLVNLYWTWQDDEYLYRVDDECERDGDGILVPRDLGEMRKWAGQLALAVHYIHSYGLVHGNIHPRSLFLSDALTRDLRLTSFNHLRPLEDGGRKLSGAYGDYESFRAPEGEYFEEVDWYAFGKTLALWRSQRLEYNGSDDLNDLVYRMTKGEAESRLGYGPGAFKSIQSHPFFTETNWPHLLRLSTTTSRSSFHSLTASIDSLKRATSTTSSRSWEEFLEFSWDVDGQIGETLESLYK